jgi:hypothetical protein
LNYLSVKTKEAVRVGPVLTAGAFTAGSQNIKSITFAQGMFRITGVHNGFTHMIDVPISNVSYATPMEEQKVIKPEAVVVPEPEAQPVARRGRKPKEANA